MKKFLLPIVLISAFFLSSSLNAQKMNNKKLNKILEEVSDSIQSQEGYWQFKYFDRFFIVVTDQENNRMRIISPIVEEEKLDETYYKKCLEANYHSALDVKYAISEKIIWSVFIHPLKELSENQVKDAIQQVYSAAATFGYSYTSTDLTFGSSN